MSIDAALVSRLGSIRDIAGQHGLTRSSVDRHRAAHIPQALALATQAAEVVEAGTLLDQVRALLTDAKRVQKAAEEAKDLRTALGGIREQARILELLGKLLGELDAGSQTTVNVLALSSNAEWAAVRAALMQALAPFPEARSAVVMALGKGGQP